MDWYWHDEILWKGEELPTSAQMTREETAEWVGYYFGLQRAVNMYVVVADPALAQGAGVAINKLRRLIDAEMEKSAAKLPEGTLDTWPNVTPSTPS